jgi:tripartite-type tricarboxylate transporter receptor subunit TctC
MKVMQSCLMGFAVAFAFATGAPAQRYPVKPARYVVPVSAGSGADTIGRIVAMGQGAARVN